MNSKARKNFYWQLVERDGTNCKICLVNNTEKKLVIDHIDNNNSNNVLENLQLLCRKCNYYKNPRPFDSCESDKTKSTSISINQQKEKEFRNSVYERIILRNKREGRKEIINSVAEKVNISPVTAGRYFDKMSSDDGLVEKKNGFYKMKPGWMYFIPKRDEQIIIFCLSMLDSKEARSVIELLEKEKMGEEKRVEEKTETELEEPKEPKKLDEFFWK